MKAFIFIFFIFLFATGLSAQETLEGEKAFEISVTQAQYPGGQKELAKFLSENVIYPDMARKNNIQGRVFIALTINRDGLISESKILKSVDPLLDAEALRVVKLMPKWVPATQRGKAIKSKFTLPISFRLG